MKNDKLKFEVFDNHPSEWDEFVKSNHGFFVQTSSWVSIFSKTGIGSGKYIQGYKNGKVVLQLLMWDSLLGGTLLLDKIPSPFLRMLSSIPYLRSYSFHMGPVFNQSSLTDKEKDDYLTQLLDFILSLAEKEKKNIGPGSLLVFPRRENADRLKKKFNKRLSIKTIATVRTTITQDLDHMSRVVEYSRRKNINRAERNGIVVKEYGIEKIDYYWKYLHESWAQYGLSVPSIKYYENFPDIGTKLFFAYDKKKLVAGNGVLVFGDTCIEFSIFITNYEKQAKTRGGDLIKWHIIDYCLKKGIQYWDLNMIDLAESDDKTKKINFYKLEWGGEIIYGVEIFKLNILMSTLQKLKWKVLGK